MHAMNKVVQKPLAIRLTSYIKKHLVSVSMDGGSPYMASSTWNFVSLASKSQFFTGITSSQDML